MPDTKITALTALTAADPANDVLPIVDVSDTTMAASGTTKKISINSILGASGTATLASATISGAASAAGLTVTGSPIPANGVYLPSANNLGFAYNSTLGMTLNSTGLGVAVSPDFKFAVSGAQAVPDTTGSSTANGSLRIGAVGTGLCIDSGVTAATDVYGWIQARSRTNYATNFNLVLQPNGGNVGIGFVPGAGGFSKVLFIGTGTEPTAGATGAVQYFTSTRSANNTIPAILCEGSGVTNAGITSTTVTHKIAMKVNGTIYYLLATTSAA